MVNLNNLFLRMKELNLTSKKLSDDTGISTGNISDWKKGRSMPTAIKLITLADYLNCSVDYILGRTDNPEVNKVEEKPLHILDSALINSDNKTVILPFYRTPASAGTGSWLTGDITTEYVNTPKTPISCDADFIIEVRGNSMYPTFSDGDRILVKQSTSIYENEIGVFILNGESYVKKMGMGELLSINSNYAPIKLKEYDNIRCVGRVVGKIE